MSFQKVAQVAEEFQKNSKAPLGFVFKDLQTGQVISYHGDQAFPTASAYKIFILAELFRKAYAGECSLDDRYPLTDEVKSVGSGVLADLQAGLNLTLRDYATLMMILSDNTATDVLFRFVGRDNIKKNVIDALGLKNTKADWGCNDLCSIYYDLNGRTFEELDEEEADTGIPHSYWHSKWYQCITEENDQTAPLEAAKMLELLYRGQWVSPEASEGMLDIMRRCQTNSRIPKNLPDAVRVAHKTGTLDKLNVDIGIVYTRTKGDYILCLFYNGNMAENEADYNANDRGRVGDTYLADLSGALYRAYMED